MNINRILKITINLEMAEPMMQFAFLALIFLFCPLACFLTSFINEYGLNSLLLILDIFL